MFVVQKPNVSLTINMMSISLGDLHSGDCSASFVSDGDNSLNMRSVKVGAYEVMNHVCGAGGFCYPTAQVWARVTSSGFQPMQTEAPQALHACPTTFLS